MGRRSLHCGALCSMPSEWLSRELSGRKHGLHRGSRPDRGLDLSITRRRARWSRMPAMAESASQSITIAASPEHCFAVATDFARYPDWVNDSTEAVVREKALAVGAQAWIDELPGLVEAIEADWGIAVGRTYADSTEAVVAEATCADGTPAVVDPHDAGSELRHPVHEHHRSHHTVADRHQRGVAARSCGGVVGLEPRCRGAAPS